MDAAVAIDPVDNVVHVPERASTPWVPVTFEQSLAAAALRWPDREALVIDGARWTFGRLQCEAQRVARALVAHGVAPGDHVGICTGNRVEWVSFFLGAALAGAVTVPVNTRFKADELRYCLAQADVTLLAVADRFLKVDFIAMLRGIEPAVDAALPGAALPRLRHVAVLGEDIPAGASGWDAFLAAGEALPVPSGRAAPGSVVLIQYTSGSTSFPKGVQLSHDNMLRNADAIADRIGLEAGDRYFSARPFFHVAGTTLSILAALSRGSCLVSTPVFDAGTSLDGIEAERCTFLSGNDPMFQMMLSHPSLPSRKLVLRGGWGSCTPQMMQAAEETLGMKICHAYGLSEASPNVCMSDWRDPPEKRWNSYALPLPGLSVRMVDAQTGRAVPAGATGEIQVKGWSLMQGYYGMPEQTAQTFTADGWLRTGDLGTFDAQGRMHFIGRIKEVFRVGGENVAPAEVEDLLLRHPAVAQAQVVGVPDARLGEVGAAYVVLREGADLSPAELIEWTRPRIANFKVPRHAKVVDGFEAIGMTASVKVQKNRLREHALRDFGLEKEAK
ncbi:MAG: AMP-binding protein [Burkholderiales bacterium]|nr:AMP-binding protein [Burkholderiales bacterium]